MRWILDQELQAERAGMAAREINIGEVVDGRYELELPIGKGGMAEVWRATDRLEHRLVAVKFLRPAEEVLRQVDTRYQEDEITVMHKRFNREARLLSQLNHPGIPALYDEGKHRGTPYLVMRYIDGMSIGDFLALRRPLPLGPAVSITVQIASALDSAHTLPVVHRDLKPQNIMLSTSGVAVLLDFGIAQPLGAGATRYTQYGSSLGSPGYQAPEQIRGDSVVPETDSYALGCVCYEMLTGHTPFAEEHGGLQGQHLDADPLPLRTFAPQVPAELDDLVLRMLAKAPERRPGMAEIEEVFRRYLPLPGSPPPSPRLDPDPTLPFRAPDDYIEESNTDRTASASTEPKSAEWLKVRGVEADCEQGEQELTTGDPGPALARLADLAAAARKQWGPARPLVRQVWRLAAEGLRILGDCGRAATFYQQMLDDLAHSRSPQDQATALIWRLRVAECRLPFGDSDFALETLFEVATAGRALSSQTARGVQDVCRELETELNELGHSVEVQRLLKRLEQELD
ncbi:serine/threonine-protein kinase [Umezawaea endophytica]|uniref:non-specific serine/threonine protein kinase n=1 Tax=Umezawaea endophytica TaxID=1654476 RepID=A0A9X2VXP8_9PSEU|nr:serine/threonine-protein kinase [Umezawaea endophytica]MCS7484810.1 serine/threonine protein kinase [Umezawaea endophytica]